MTAINEQSTQPPFGIRGIIEGFYGVPWTHEQRLDIIDFIARHGMNTFVYSPKDDPLMRHEWRRPYTGPELARLRELVDQCHQHDVDFVFCLSPGLSMEYSSEDDVSILAAKFISIADLGVSHFGLLLDDIPWELQHSTDQDRFQDLADAHCHVINAVYQQLLHSHPRHRLIVCPTQYWGYGDEPYVARLGSAIDPRVNVFWTGRAICSATLDLPDAATVSRTLARPVTYWDNYPVNDVAMGHELHIGPYQGRDRHLYRFSTGVIANGMSRFEASKIAFGTIADYLNDPENYDPEVSWRASINDVMGNSDDADALMVFADNVRSSCLSDTDAPTVSHALEQFMFHANLGHAQQARAALRPVADMLLAAADHLLRDRVANSALVDEARPWLEAFEIGARALDFIAERCAENAVDAGIARELGRFLDRFKATGKRVYGDVLEMTLSDLIASSSVSPG